MNDPEWLSIEDYHEHINGVLSAWLIGQMARRGELRSVKVGGRRLIHRDALTRLAEEQEVLREWKKEPRMIALPGRERRRAG
jgi:excisionase family DNA binding protein